MMDGANGWQRFWRITLPQLRPDAVHGAHARPDRLLAGVRPDLHRHPGRPGEDDADPGLPVVPGGLRESEVGTGRGDRVHPVRSSSSCSRSSSAGCCASVRCRSGAAAALPGEDQPPTALTAPCTREGIDVVTVTPVAVADTAVVTPPRRRLGGPGAGPAGATGQVLLYAALIASRAHLHLPVPGAGRDVVQDGCRRHRRPDLAHPATLVVRGLRAAVHPQRLPAVVRELRDRHDLRHARPGVLRVARRATPSPGCTSAVAR